MEKVANSIKKQSCKNEFKLRQPAGEETEPLSGRLSKFSGRPIQAKACLQKQATKSAVQPKCAVPEERQTQEPEPDEISHQRQKTIKLQDVRPRGAYNRPVKYYIFNITLFIYKLLSLQMEVDRNDLEKKEDKIERTEEKKENKEEEKAKKEEKEKPEEKQQSSPTSQIKKLLKRIVFRGE
ncbi:uncharacterized protein LOC117600481 isoform X2 [Osmia lignaria lignaria]|uniref:uncharacterized protein LOC117600481 isoform X2 n=1 Tax=Osmia lignaria lignaria TaxID=1437193 RepID=UPI00402B312A